jgi:methyltransferase (TIGR00027 family)
MKTGRISQTALKVALIMLTLNEKPSWRKRLPANLADVTEKLLLAAAIPGISPRLIRDNKRWAAVVLADILETRMPGTFEGIGERKIFIDQQVRQAIEAGATQVLVLGAGFDSLCLRLAADFTSAQFFELDHPATSQAKQRGVAALGQPDNLSFINADLRQQALTDVLQNTPDWDTGARTVVIAEGLFLYLTEADVLALFAAVDACTGEHSRVVFSHGLSAQGYQVANLFLNIIGEPWLSACPAAELGGYIGRGWQVNVTQPPRTRRDLEGFAVAAKTSIIQT